ncbi:MAG: metal-dependent hydrolase [Agitococcus sp.]|nr:metal-dependent hydrolase [Agitococcus sp.]
MSNARAHALGAAVGVGLMIAVDENKRGVSTSAPLVGGSLASLLGSLPDLIEPALHPNHRQFFHSLTFASLLISGMKSAYEWQPKPHDDAGRMLRALGLIGSGAYLVHLMMDATTPKSIPFLGRL